MNCRTFSPNPRPAREEKATTTTTSYMISDARWTATVNPGRNTSRQSTSESPPHSLWNRPFDVWRRSKNNDVEWSLKPEMRQSYGNGRSMQGYVHFVLYPQNRMHIALHTSGLTEGTCSDTAFLAEGIFTCFFSHPVFFCLFRYRRCHPQCRICLNTRDYLTMFYSFLGWQVVERCLCCPISYIQLKSGSSSTPLVSGLTCVKTNCCVTALCCHKMHPFVSNMGTRFHGTVLFYFSISVRPYPSIKLIPMLLHVWRLHRFLSF